MNFMGLFKNIPDPTFSISISRPSPHRLSHSLTHYNITFRISLPIRFYSMQHNFRSVRPWNREILALSDGA